MSDWLDKFEPKEKNQELHTRLAGGFIALASLGLGALQFFNLGPYADPTFYSAIPSVVHFLPYIGLIGALLMIWRPEFFSSKSKNPEAEQSDE